MMGFALGAAVIALIWSVFRVLALKAGNLALAQENSELSNDIQLRQKRLREVVACITIDASRRPMRFPEVDLEHWDVDFDRMRAVEKKFPEQFSMPLQFKFENSHTLRRQDDGTWELKSLEPNTQDSWKPVPEKLLAALETARVLHAQLTSHRFLEPQAPGRGTPNPL